MPCGAQFYYIRLAPPAASPDILSCDSEVYVRNAVSLVGVTVGPDFSWSGQYNYRTTYCLKAGPTLCTYIHNQAMFRHVSMASTTIIREDNATDQKTPIYEAVQLVMHTSLYFVFPFNSDLVYVTLPTYILAMPLTQQGRQSELNIILRLYGEMNSVKKHNYKIWLNDGVYQQGKTTCFDL